MTDLLAQLLARHHGIPGAVAPRVPSLYEPPSLAAADEPFTPRAPAATSPALTPDVDASFDAPRSTVLSAAPAPSSTPAAAPTRPAPAPATHRSAPAPLAVDRAPASTPMPDGATAKERAAPPAAAATASVRASRTPEEAMRTERVPSPVRAPPTVRPTRASSSVPVQASATTPAPTAPSPPVVSALQPLATRPARPEPPSMVVRPAAALRSDTREPAAPQPVPRDTTPRDTPPGPERPPPPVIEVTIGRIEIRARAPERAPQPAPAALTSLDQYMRQHADRRRP